MDGPALKVAPGQHLVLPSGRSVEVLRHSRSTIDASWLCAYTVGSCGKLRMSRSSNWATLTLLDRWLRRYARPME